MLAPPAAPSQSTASPLLARFAPSQPHPPGLLPPLAGTTAWPEQHSLLPQTPPGVLLLLAGTDPFYLVDAGVAAAAALSGGAKPRAHKRLPPSLDAFGWCTWDAFYSTVSARGLQEGLASLHSGGVFPR